MLKENQFDYNNVKLHYVRTVDGGPPVILLHGLSDRWQSYLPLIPFLYPYYAIYAPDLRGHGKSYRAESYRIIDYVYDIESFLINLFNEPVFFIGHSLGATISLCIAAKYPERCKGLSLIDPFIFGDKLDDGEFRKYFTNCLKVCTLYRDVDSVSKNIKETGTLAKKRAADLIQLDKKTIEIVLNKTIFEGFDLEEILSKITCPVLVLRGNPDLEGFITEEKANYLKEKISNCTVEYLEDSSHIVHVDQPLKTARHLLEFFASI